ncbi:hypothetical protein LguiA_002395 [Lonicera macranthoides]
MKILVYSVIFAVFQTSVITLFALIVMKFKTPKFRVTSASFATFDVQSTPSFSMGMVTETGVKNTNFGQFKYDNTTVDFYYRDTKVGEGVVERGRAKWRFTRMFKVIVDLSSNNISSNSQLANDVNSGILPLTTWSRLRGRVTIMFFMEKNKFVNMNCTMDLAIRTRQLQNVFCN